MLPIKKYIVATVDLLLIAIALGGLLFACTNQEVDRQRQGREAAVIQAVALQAPLDTLVNLDESLWRITGEGLAVHIDPELGLLVDVRYWSRDKDTMLEKMKSAGYKLDYINTTNQRLRLWVKTQLQLQQLAGMNGVSVVSASAGMTKRELTMKAFDERKN